MTVKKPSKLPIEVAFTMPSPIHRPTRRPTLTIKAVDPRRVQESVLGVFRRFSVISMDIDTLLFYALQAFDPDMKPEEFEGMHRYMRAHVMKNFATFQGETLRLTDFSMHRLTVCYTDDTDV